MLDNRSTLSCRLLREKLVNADVHWGLHLLLALDEDSLNVPTLDADGYGDLVAADAGVADGMLREERQDPVATDDALGY